MYAPTKGEEKERKEKNEKNIMGHHGTSWNIMEQCSIGTSLTIVEHHGTS